MLNTKKNNNNVAIYFLMDPLLNQNGDPYTAYSENFLKSHVIPELLKETKQLDPHFTEGVKSAIVTDQIDSEIDSLDSEIFKIYIK
ncbi:719_t:CDS:2 [Entrophospora sp. SA101]|nr:719_t:CDS:2 [Entrophospora sp. SA101]